MKKNNSYTEVVCDVLLVRLLFSNILLNLIQQRELVRSSHQSDYFLKSFAEYGMNVFGSLEKLHRVLLPFDSALGSIDLKDCTLKPEYRSDVKPGESIR